MTMELEDRIARQGARLDELEEAVAELETFRAWVLDPDADEGYDTPPTAAELERMKRPELDELAAAAGVDSPDELATKADVAAAIVAKRDGQ